MRAEIIRIPILPFGMLNAYLLVLEGKAILIDAGLPGSQARIQHALKSAGLTPADVRLIVITHGHIDHAGDAHHWRTLSGAPVLLHRDEMQYCNGTFRYEFKPSRIFGKLFFHTGLISRPYTFFEPDIVLGNDPFDLNDFGFDGVALHTPGHTAGSASIVLRDGRAIVGDLLASGILLGGIAFRHKPQSPPFEDDGHMVAQQIRRLAGMGVSAFYPGHGMTVEQRKALSHAERLAGV